MVSECESGLYAKYEVFEDGEAVDGAFVLEPESDRAARRALETYIAETDDEELAQDLREWTAAIEMEEVIEMPSDSRNQSVICTHCGEEVEEDDATYGGGSVQEDGAERLAKGETVGLDEVFAFDEPYCSVDCLLAGDGDE